jgi:hypothetical protein
MMPLERCNVDDRFGPCGASVYYISDDSSISWSLGCLGLPTTLKIDESLIRPFPVTVPLETRNCHHCMCFPTFNLRFIICLWNSSFSLHSHLNTNIMGLPWELITAFAATGTLSLAWAQNSWVRLQLLGHFTEFWFASLAVWGIWAVWIYPLFVSPLRHLPGPSGNHWFMGQAQKIMAEPSGVPMREWFVGVFLVSNSR